MAFIMKGAPYNMDNTPIYQVDMEDNVLGMAQNNGTILVNRKLSPLELKKNKTISHEKIHLDQMRRGDLEYTDDYVLWKGKKYDRATLDEGNPKLPWELEAWKNQ